MRQTLFPDIEPTQTGMLDLDGLHAMYWEVSGKADGVPVVFLHGGPGAGASANHRRYFDPDFWRIIIFDQRGAGRSKPLGELHDNTTQHLVADMERLRGHLGVERWLMFGGSWGSTLALAYGEAFPERCLGMVLRGIFLCRQHEIDWFLYGMRAVFPEAWRRFTEFLPAIERDDLLEGYHRRLTDPDPAVHMPAARAWSGYEGACSTLLCNPNGQASLGGDRMALGLARIEAHYFKHGIFIDDDALLAGLGRLKGVPGAIVQGRYDMVCPIATADELARAWPRNSEGEGDSQDGGNGALDYVIVPDAGHAASEPGIRKALIKATEDFKTRIAKAAG